MALQKAVDTQRDFSAGELDPSAKRRDDDEFVKKGMRQLSNARVLNTGAVTQRPGRNLIRSLASAGRVEDVLIAPGVRYRLAFTSAALTIYDSTGTSVFSLGSRPWTDTTVDDIVWTVFLKQIFITFPGAVPLVLTWDGATTWTSGNYAEAIETTGQKRTPFYRLAPLGITLRPSATIGVVNLTFSLPVLVAGMVGTRIRYCGRQLQIATVTSSTTGTATVVEPLPPSQTLVLTGVLGQFNIGDVLEGGGSGARGVIISVPTSQSMSFSPSLLTLTTFQVGDAVAGGTSGAAGVVSAVFIDPGDSSRPPGITGIAVTLTAGTFTAGENVSGPHGNANNFGVSGTGLVVQLIATDTGGIKFFVNTEGVASTTASGVVNGVPAVGVPQAVSIWDQEVMNSFQGFPASCFVDQSRLGFCDFPALPGAIAWSAIGLVTDLFPGADPAGAIFELAPGKSRVQHIVPGPEGSEFVFCDNAVYYIPISATNPLRPGSVAFPKVSSDGAATVQPRAVGNVILYVDQGLIQVQSIVATGAYNRPYESRALTDMHSHLFNGIKAIALPTSVTQFPERYAYVLNADGTMAVGKYVLDANSNLAGKVGWLPWNGSGVVRWISALNDVVLMQTDYNVDEGGSVGGGGGTTIDAIPTAHMLEQLDATLYLDASLPVNAIPSTLTPPGGKGPLWWLPGATVDLMDGRLPLGPHATDANGFLVPLFPGENLTSVTLRAGFTWTGVWEPFVLTSQGSQGADERMKRRRIARLQAYVEESSGFLFAKFYSGTVGPDLPALGDIVGSRRIAAYNQGDDATQAPPLREQSYAYKPLGRAHDPRAGIIKDTPGPLTLVEMAAKASI